MKISYMEEYISLIELRNFTRAAEQMYISQSTFSKHILELERDFDCQLIIRTKHKVEPTETGMKVYYQFKKIVALYHDTLEHVRLAKSGIVGTLRLGVLYYSLDVLIDPIVQKFREKYPNIKLSILSLQPPQMQSYLEQDRIDMGINIFYPKVSLYPPNIKVVVFYRDTLILAVNETSLLSKQSTVSLQDVQGKTVILMEDEPDYNEYINQLLIREQVQPQNFYFSSQIDTTFSDIRYYDGVFFLPKQMIDLHKNNIRFIPLAEAVASVNMACLYKQDCTNLAVSYMIDVIKGLFTDLH